MNTSQQQSRKKNILLILAVLAVIIGLSLLFLQINGANSLRVSVEDEKMALSQAEALLQQRLESRANEAVYREKAARYQAMIPSQPQEEVILRTIRRIAEEYDMRVLEVRFDERLPNPDNGLVQMPMVITIEGNYGSLIQMLDHLQWGGRAFRVDQVNISLTVAEQSGIRAVLTASAFFRNGN